MPRSEDKFSVFRRARDLSAGLFSCPASKLIFLIAQPQFDLASLTRDNQCSIRSKSMFSVIRPNIGVRAEKSFFVKTLKSTLSVLLTTFLSFLS